MSRQAETMKFICKHHLFLLLLLSALLFSCAFGEEGSIVGEIEVTPSVLSAAGDVQVQITVSNSGEENMTDPVYLYSPQGKIVDDFAMGGFAILKSGQSVTWNGTCSVTDQTLEDGKIVYYIMYTVYDENGESHSEKKPLSADIQKSGEEASSETDALVVERVISPTVAKEGQEVTVKYSISNKSKASLYNVSIQENKEIHEEKETIPELNGGATAEITYTTTMKKKSLTSSAIITYSLTKNGEKHTYEVEEATIAYGEPNLTASLVSSSNAVKENGTVTLTLTLNNTGTVGYSDIRVTDPVLGEMFTGQELAAGKTLELQKEVTVPENMEYCFTVEAVDETGLPLSITTNTVSVSSVREEDTLNLSVQVQADRTEVYETPGKVRFTITIQNTSNVDAKDAVLSHGEVTIASLGDIKAGESRVLSRDTLVSMSGRMRFTVSAIDALGNTQSFNSNDIQIVITAPTAAPVTPTPVPIPTVVPESALATNPVVSDASIAPGAKLAHAICMPVMIVAGIIGIAAAALLIVAKVRRAGNKKSSDDALDQLQRTDHRDYTVPAQNTEEENQEDTPEENNPAAASLEEDFSTRVPNYASKMSFDTQGEESHAPLKDDSNPFMNTSVDIEQFFQKNRMADDLSFRENSEISENAASPMRRRGQRNDSFQEEDQ